MDGDKQIPVHYTLIYSTRTQHPLLILLHHHTQPIKENNASRRLGSASNYKLGDQIMCSMSEAASNDESNTLDDQAEDQGFLYRHSTAIATLTAAYFATFVIAIIFSRMWNEDEIRLHILNVAMRILQAIARLIGGWALTCEQAYNDYANTLH